MCNTTQKPDDRDFCFVKNDFQNTLHAIAVSLISKSLIKNLTFPSFELCICQNAKQR